MVFWDGLKLIEAAIAGLMVLVIVAMVGFCWLSMKYDQWKKRRK